jgi:predicted secreted protein
MTMGWASGTATYLIIWWLVIFMVLPWGVRPVAREDLGKGEDTGAPQKPRILIKVAVTTVITTILWGIFYWAVDSGLISFR